MSTAKGERAAGPLPASHPLNVMQERHKGSMAQPAEPQAEDAKTPEARGRRLWLDAWHDPVAGLAAYSRNLAVGDLEGDGDHRLLVATVDRTLRVFQGTNMRSENALLEQPCAISVLYINQEMPRVPYVAVASGPFVFVYAKLRPFFKFSLPSLPIDERETQVWERVREGKLDAAPLRDELVELKENGCPLSSRSLDVIALAEKPGSEDEIATYVDARKQLPLVQQTVITCMDVLKKSMDQEDSVGMLVIGTESKEILIMAVQAQSIINRIKLEGIPAFVGITGLYDVEYRIVVACRNGYVYSIKNGELLGNVISLETIPTGLVRIDKSIYVSGMDNAVHCYHLKGKKTYSMYMPDAITNLELMHAKSRNYKALLVALRTGEVRMYHERQLVSTFKMEEPVTGMRFGRYGREDNVLVVVTRSGALTIKIMPRTAKLDTTSGPAGAPAEQDIPLAVPKKTKLYIEQTNRERENVVEMHRVFQRDLYKLRLITSRSYVKVLSDTQGPIASTGGTNLKLNMSVQGIGPLFKIKLNIQNNGNKTVSGIVIHYAYDPTLYRLSANITKLPALVPRLAYRFEVAAESLDDSATSGVVRALVVGPKSSLPLITGIVNMPISELLYD